MAEMLLGTRGKGHSEVSGEEILDEIIQMWWAYFVAIYGKL